MSTKTYLSAAAALGLLLAPSLAFASDSLLDDRQIDGRSIFSIESSLAQQGIAADRVEEWGNAIRVDARAADGSSYVVIVDKDTLRPLDAANAVGTRVDVGGSPSTSGWANGFNSSPESLVD